MRQVSFIQRPDERSDASPPVIPKWLEECATEFLLTVSNTAYPCYFGSAAIKENALSFAYVLDSHDANAAQTLERILRAYLEIALTGPARQSLVVFVGPPRSEIDFKTDFDRFWDLLSATSTQDVAPWPPDIPHDSADPHWQWSFAGKQWFVLGCSPAYRRRRSRNVGQCLTMIFQLSERVFEGLGGSTSAGKHAKKTIRRRLTAFDGISVHPHTGNEDQSSVFKWRQYFLPDDESQLDESMCPFHR